MIKLITVPLFTIIAVFTPFIANAQNKSEKPITCRVLYLTQSRQKITEIELFDGIASQKIELPKYNLSKVYELPPKTRRLHLLKNPLINPEELPANSPSAVISETAQNIYLIITKDPSNKVLPFKINVIELDPNSFGKNEMLWINLSDKNVFGKVGSQKLNIRAKKMFTLNTPAKKAGYFPVSLEYRISGAKKAHDLCHTQWRFNPKASNSIVFILNTNKRTAPLVFRYADHRVSKDE